MLEYIEGNNKLSQRLTLSYKETKYSLHLCLKIFKFWEAFISAGIWFHKVGAE